jgi:serine/threonine protein kinase/Tol biopolymer transport system component
LQAGEQIGRYVVEGLLGEGGMGQVYRAYDATLNRRVAIKLLRPDDMPGSNDTESSAGVPSVTRVLREARMAAALDHPNVVSIFDVGEQDGNPFIVMELVNGRSLRACIGLHEIPVTERVHWLLGIARGLAAAHHVGLVHRDVKPENVLVRDDGVVKVLDFGIARLERLPSQRPPSGRMPAIATAGGTLESTLAGTPAYMAPEQIRRDSVDARVDQFAWGVVAYELLAGSLPWSVGSEGPVSILGAVLEKDPPRLSAAKLGIAGSFVDTVHRALAKSRAARFGSMDELLLASGLAYSKGDLPMPGPRPSLHPSADSSQRLNVPLPADIASAPTLLATSSASSLASAAQSAVREQTARKKHSNKLVLFGLLGALALCTAIVAIGYRRPPPPVDGPPATLRPVPTFQPHDARRLTFDQGCEEFPSLSPNGASVAFDSSIGDDIQIVVLDVASGKQRKLTDEPGWHFSPTISPDGTRIAYLRQHGDEVGTWVAPFDGSSAPRLVASGRMRPAWSPDGRGIWAGSIDRPTRLDLATGAVTRTLDAPEGFFVLRTRELADGRVVGRLMDRPTKRGRGLVIYAKDSATPSPLFVDATEDSIGVVPDGSRLLVPKLLLPTSRIELWQVPLDGSAPAIVPDQLVLPTKGLDFARDGSSVVWSTCSTEQDVARLDGEKSLQASELLPKTEWTDEQPAGIPGAPTKMVIVSDRAERRQLWVVDLSGKEAARRLPMADLEASSPAVSPDAKWVAFTGVGKGIYVVALDGASAARQVTKGSEDASASFSSDGASIYFDTPSGPRRHALSRIAFDGSAPATSLVEDAERSSASPVDNRVVYLASEDEQGTPMIYDATTRKSRRLSKAYGKGVYGTLRFSPDGSRIALSVGLNDVLEVDAKTGEVARRFTSGDQVTGLAYVGKDIVISRDGWHGDVWIAQGPWGK